MAKKKSSQQDASPASSDARQANPWHEVDRAIESFLDRGWERLTALDKRLPRVDVIDRDAEVVVRAEVPGFSRDELDVSVTDKAVTLKGEHRESRQEESGEYHRAEIQRGAFARTLPLPAEIDADKAEARFDNGMLELTLPKLKEARRRRLEVK